MGDSGVSLLVSLSSSLSMPVRGTVRRTLSLQFPPVGVGPLSLLLRLLQLALQLLHAGVQLVHLQRDTLHHLGLQGGHVGFVLGLDGPLQLLQLQLQLLVLTLQLTASALHPLTGAALRRQLHLLLQLSDTSLKTPPLLHHLSTEGEKSSRQLLKGRKEKRNNVQFASKKTGSISASMPFSFFSVSLLTARISSRDMRRSLLLLAHLVLPGQVPLVLSLHGLHVDFQAQLSVFVPCSSSSSSSSCVFISSSCCVQLSGQSQSSGLLLSGLGFSFVSLLCVTSRDVGDDLPQVVLVHQQVVELLLNASLGFVELLEGGALLLHALVGSLQVSLVSLLRLLRRLQRPCLGLHDRAVFSGLDGLPLHIAQQHAHTLHLCLSLSENLSCSSWTDPSAFFLRCSESPFPCIRVWISMASSLLQLLVELVEGLPVFLPHLPQLLLVDFSLVVQSPFQMSHLGLTLRPERGNGVQRVLQLRLQRLQLLPQVSAVFLCLGASLPLQIQILLQLRQLSLHLSDLLLGQVLLSRLLLDPEGGRGGENNEPGQSRLELLLLLGQLSAQLGDLSLQLGDLVVDLVEVAVQLASVLLQLLA
ncbi:hypothetical protein F7725_003916 [Dissostichus mawsoni]|uniref:Uncharacterized protein n=1 Tax=Dissostichus mawsoni TaxID=36200 RepID=A0A7J5YEW2_DISMA|nr:hypothetical protein F7725_003916 [Dissostichus mawsoni]